MDVLVQQSARDWGYSSVSFSNGLEQSKIHTSQGSKISASGANGSSVFVKPFFLIIAFMCAKGVGTLMPYPCFRMFSNSSDRWPFPGWRLSMKLM